MLFRNHPQIYKTYITTQRSDANFIRRLAEEPDLNYPVVMCHMVQMHLENVKIKMLD